MGNIHEAVLSPSSSERWINCPKSSVYEKDFKLLDSDEYDERNIARKEGTLAHKIAARMLNSRLNKNAHIFARSDFNDLVYQSEIIDEDEIINEMIEYSKQYVEIVEESYESIKSDIFPLVIRVEHEIDCSELGANIIGTPDLFMFSGNKLIIIDYKFGKKVKVTAEDNPQLMIYALGVLSTFKEFVEKIDTITLMVFQPRKGGLKAVTLKRDELFDWKEDVLTPALEELRRRDKEEYAGPWCRFCNGTAYCMSYQKMKTHYRYSYRALSDESIKNMRSLAERAKMIKEKLIKPDEKFLTMQWNTAAQEFSKVTQLLERLCIIYNSLSYSQKPKSDMHNTITKELISEKLYVVSDNTLDRLTSISDFKIIFKKTLEGKEPIVIEDESGNRCMLINSDQLSRENTDVLKTAILHNTCLSLEGKTYLMVEKSLLDEFAERNKLLIPYLENIRKIAEYCNSILIDICEISGLDSNAFEIPDKNTNFDNSYYQQNDRSHFFLNPFQKN